MVDFTENDRGSAAGIVERLFSEGREGFDLPSGMSIVDVERDSISFAGDLEILNAIGANAPALRVGEEGPVPISLSLLDPEPLGWGRYPSLLRRPYDLYEYYYSILRRDEYLPQNVERIPPEQARSNFIRRATDFLAVRIAAIREFHRGREDSSTLNILQRLRGARVSVPGCLFSVSTNSTGLRVFWSGAYYISANYFGHPTFPVKSILQSGSYVFGVDGGAYGNIVQWDTSAVCTLPGKPSVHLNY